MDRENIPTNHPNYNNPWLKEGLFDDIEKTSSEPNGSPSAPRAPNFKSPDSHCDFYLHEIQHLGRMEKVTDFINSALGRTPAQYDSVADFDRANPNYQSDLDARLDYSMKSALREYTGYNFSWINNIERGIWDYEKMGRHTPELEARYRATADTMDAAIKTAPAPQEDFTTFRGTNLSSFRNYGITSLRELTKMQGQFMLERGFMSTALVREQSFVAREVSGFFISKPDIEIRYHIPKESHDAAALFTKDLSYSPQQTEVLVNRHTLNYIFKVYFDASGHAVVDMLMIPSEVYDY